MELITSKSNEDKNLQKLREQFIINYCENNGWDKDNLTSEQINIIKSYKEYQTPFLIRS